METASSLLPAVLTGLVFLSLVAIALLAVQRRFPLVGQLAFPVFVAAFAFGLWVALLFNLGDISAHEGGRLLLAAVVFLVIVVVLRVLGWYIFDVHLGRHKGMELPSLLPKVMIGVAYITAGLIILKYIGQ